MHVACLYIYMSCFWYDFEAYAFQRGWCWQIYYRNMTNWLGNLNNQVLTSIWSVNMHNHIFLLTYARLCEIDENEKYEWKYVLNLVVCMICVCTACICNAYEIYMCLIITYILVCMITLYREEMYIYEMLLAGMIWYGLVIICNIFCRRSY
jgi:hypothetical protein